MSEHIDYDKEAKLRVWHLNKTGGAAADGLTVRDYFAANVLSGWLASFDSAECDEEGLVVFAYRLADAMMKERAK